jgi:hypothetical protein
VRQHCYHPDEEHLPANFTLQQAVQATATAIAAATKFALHIIQAQTTDRRTLLYPLNQSLPQPCAPRITYSGLHSSSAVAALLAAFFLIPSTQPNPSPSRSIYLCHLA